MSVVPGQAATEKGVLAFVLALVCGKRMGSNIVKIYLIFLPGEKKIILSSGIIKAHFGYRFFEVN